MKQKALHWLTCALLLTGVPAIAGAQSTEVPHIAESLRQIIQAQPELSERVQQLDQLGAWLREGKESQTRAWIRAHREQALTLAEEVYIDVHASPWLALTPQHPASSALLPLLAQELQEPSLIEPACKLDGFSELPTGCSQKPWVRELESLQTARILHEHHLIQALPSRSHEVMLSYEADSEDGRPLSQRGRLQKLHYEGLSGNGEASDRLQWQLESLTAARQWRAPEIEALSLLSLAETLSGDDDERYAIREELREQWGHQRPRSTSATKWPRPSVQQCLELAEQAAAVRPSERLTVELQMQRAWLSADFKALESTEARIRAIADSYAKEYLLLRLEDIEMQQQLMGHRIYEEILDQGKHLRPLAARRLIHMAGLSTNSEMQTRFSQEADPAVRIELLRAFNHDYDAYQLMNLLEQEKVSQVRQALVQALVRCFAEQKVLPEPYRGKLLDLAQDLDSGVRRSLTFALIGSEDPELPMLMLPWLDSPLPELQSAGLWAAAQLKHAEAMPKALRLLDSKDETTKWYAFWAIDELISPGQLQLLKARRPHPDAELDAGLRLVLARFEGGPSFLRELASQWTGKKDDEIRLWGYVAKARESGAFKPDDFRPWFKHADMGLRSFMIRQFIGSNPQGAENRHILASLIENSDPQIQELALEKFSAEPEFRPYFPALRKLALDANSPQATKALNKLKEIAPDQLPELIQHLPGASPELRSKVLDLLRQSDSVLSVEHAGYLESLLKDPDEHIRLEVMYLVINQGTVELKQKFLPVVLHSGPPQETMHAVIWIMTTTLVSSRLTETERARLQKAWLPTLISLYRDERPEIGVWRGSIFANLLLLADRPLAYILPIPRDLPIGDSELKILSEHIDKLKRDPEGVKALKNELSRISDPRLSGSIKRFLQHIE